MAEDPVSQHGAGLIELIAPGGCDEANHGLVRYRIDNSGRVFVPREAAFWLIRAGFSPVPPPAPEIVTAPQTGDGAANGPAPDPIRGKKSPPPAFAGASLSDGAAK
jgi:hypothetical protein